MIATLFKQVARQFPRVLSVKRPAEGSLCVSMKRQSASITAGFGYYCD